MRFCIVGAGAIGQVVGTKIALGGAEVVYLARGETLAAIKSHVLLHLASRLETEDEHLASRLTPELIGDIVSLVPEEWLGSDPQAERDAYRRYFIDRLAGPRPFVAEACGAR